MNLSGGAVNYWLKKEKILSSNLLIVTDDLNLLLGKLRLKTNGSDGGHNGLKNIQEVLGTTKYPRLRIGIGNTFSKGKQVDYVLGSWTEEEIIILDNKLKTINDMILSYCFNGINNTMNLFNNK
jgi:PTH1 family peptidyl-tRNA hydrolase